MDIDEKEIVKMVKKGGRSRETALKHLFYNKFCRNAIRSIVLKYGGNRFDVEDVYQETMILVDRKLRSNEFNHDSSLTTYMIGIAKYYWLNKMRLSTKLDYTGDISELDKKDYKNPEYVQINKEQKSTLNSLLEQLGSPCKELLTMWKLSYSMQEVVEQLGLSSTNYARKRKFRCMKALMKNIKEHEIFKEQFVI